MDFFEDEEELPPPPFGDLNRDPIGDVVVDVGEDEENEDDEGIIKAWRIPTFLHLSGTWNLSNMFCCRISCFIFSRRWAGESDMKDAFSMRRDDDCVSELLLLNDCW